jgi:hypothetical protein
MAVMDTDVKPWDEPLSSIFVMTPEKEVEAEPEG